ncbi:Hypothetical predicted protein [Pelobates cultripes]|uniref:Uncharacterized protein n=1 Tax=Pelobates cultripes TaxID=61616 RepID=A0AAD1R3Y4_PELCU|nr:Hypothetical predicted protein [Pelobates cultripes]
MDSAIPVTDGAINLPLCKRTTSRAKSTRLWKRAKAQLNSEFELSDIKEEFPESHMEDSGDLSGPDYEITDEEDANLTRDTRPIKPTKIEVDHSASGNTIGSWTLNVNPYSNLTTYVTQWSPQTTLKSILHPECASLLRRQS